MNEWMKRLALHYERIRRENPGQKLMIMFDIDGTILDMRHAIVHVLRAYDKEKRTGIFRDLRPQDIQVHEADIERMLDEADLHPEEKERVLDWYVRNFWAPGSIIEAHRPFSGVMEVIRWFQLQPDTYIGLNTGRPESIRAETLKSLNDIGDEYKVLFRDELLFMNAQGSEKVIASKIEGLRYFQAAGFRLFAFVDNEPENLYAVSEVDATGKILLLHAETIFRSKRKIPPENFASGSRYDIAHFLDGRSLPRHIQFVWHGIDTREKLDRFLSSNITWAEFRIKLDARTGKIILGQESFNRFRTVENRTLACAHIIPIFERNGKSIKFDLTGSRQVLKSIFDEIVFYQMDDARLWFNGKIEELGEEGFSLLAEGFPKAKLQCPIDSLVPLMISAPDRGLELLSRWTQWGVTRFSVGWKTPHILQVLKALDQWGFETNIHNVPDLESFLRAILLIPTSITSDFDDPYWKRSRSDLPVDFIQYEQAVANMSSGSRVKLDRK